ncbi:MAG TPA: TIGR04053 family radical SAM/SPASM domain-containing protein [Candidatus Sulfomarinibacteraceae bacterium]|nr:TIGR04053 family radical SAM/SPASM domain-containing protein [Candidatus Sulfomarinibacteraceae bacterium]
MIPGTSSILQPVPSADAGNQAPQPFVYGRAPLLIYWESTRACDLACIHCRAMAVAQRNPRELRTDEVTGLLEQIARFGPPQRGLDLPHLIITGGDPLQRPDLIELIQYANMLNIRVSVTPAGTARLTAGVIAELKAAGTVGLGLSLDGPDEERHDAFRGEAGSFNWTVSAALAARRQGMPLQVNTMVTAETLHYIPEIFQVVQELDVTRWALFFLITTGRGQALSEITPAESERFLNWLWRMADQAPFPIKTTEAHHYRRIAYLKLRSQGLSDEEIRRTPTGRGFGIRDGNGILFISHTGDIYPSGFLPLSAGNVRHKNIVDVYRRGNLFRRIRHLNQLQGKCGRCEFRAICGGSRARAFATTGDPLAADPLCPYIPRQR